MFVLFLWLIIKDWRGGGGICKIHQIKYLYYLCVSPKGLEVSTEATSLGWSNPAFVFL